MLKEGVSIKLQEGVDITSKGSVFDEELLVINEYQR